jgi:hypothetical protein
VVVADFHTMLQASNSDGLTRYLAKFPS